MARCIDKVNINLKVEKIDYDKTNSYIKNNEIVFAPVVHAKWEMESIWHEDPLTRTMTVEKRFCCSNCNKQHKVVTKYCSNCGAKMDKE